MGKYYLCKKCKEVNDEEMNTFIQKVFHTGYKSATNSTYLYSYSCGNDNYFNYEPQLMIKFHVGGIYKCMMDNYLKDDNGQFVHIDEIAGFLFEKIKIDLHGCEKIIDAIEKHYGCSASVEPKSVNDGIGITYLCDVKLRGVNRNCLVCGLASSENPVNGLLTAYRNARKALAQNGVLNKAIHGVSKYPYNHIYTYNL